MQEVLIFETGLIFSIQLQWTPSNLYSRNNLTFLLWYYYSELVALFFNFKSIVKCLRWCLRTRPNLTQGKKQLFGWKINLRCTMRGSTTPASSEYESVVHKWYTGFHKFRHTLKLMVWFLVTEEVCSSGYSKLLVFFVHIEKEKKWTFLQ